MVDKWEKELRERLSEYEIAPPEGLWEDLAAAIERESDAGIGRSYRNSRPSYGIRFKLACRKYIAGIAVILILIAVGAGILYTWNSELAFRIPDSAGLGNIQEISLNESIGPHGDIPETSNMPNSSVMSFLNSKARKKKLNLQEVDIQESMCCDSLGELKYDLISGQKGEEMQDSGSDENAGSEMQNPENNKNYGPVAVQRKFSANLSEYPSKRKNAKSYEAKRVSIGLSAAYAGNEIQKNSSVFIPSNPGGNTGNGTNDPGGMDGDNTNGPGSSNGADTNSPADPGESIQNREEVTETRQNPPLRIGLTVRYDFTDRFAIETGLIYSYTSSAVRVQMEDKITDTTYKLHYIGIPVNLKFKMFSWKGFDLYLTGGGAVEKCIYGEKNTMHLTPTSVIDSHSIPDSYPWQWSLTAGPGIQYSPIESLGVYIEPGLIYYPVASGSLPSYYNERPFRFSLSAGIRFMISR